MAGIGEDFLFSGTTGDVIGAPPVVLEDIAEPEMAYMVRDSLTVAHTLLRRAVFEYNAASGVQLVDLQTVARFAALDDELVVEALAAGTPMWRVAAQLNLTPTIVAALTSSESLSDGVNMLDTLGRFLGGDLIETLELDDVAEKRLHRGALASVGLEIEDAHDLVRVVKEIIADQVDISPERAIQLLLGLSTTTHIMPQQVAQLALQTELADGAEMTPLASLAQALAAVDTVEVQPEAAPTLVVRADLVEGVDLSPEALVQQLLGAVVIEGVKLYGAYVSPGDTVLTWAMNMRNTALTEYTGYEFNSFARMGLQYIAASEDGLYELNGDDDDGEDIIAHLRSGFIQFGHSRFSSLASAYMGVRGDGDVFFKIVTGDGKSYTYQVELRNTETTRVKMGKGIRTRYFAFELVTTGQDFDLDDVEFVPIVAQRRV